MEGEKGYQSVIMYAFSIKFWVLVEGVVVEERDSESLTFSYCAATKFHSSHAS